MGFHNSGYTESIRQDYIRQRDAKGSKYRLEWWDLYEVLGEKRIEDIVRLFYKKVWCDKEAWFREMFTNVTNYENAVWAQKMFWIDSFGGGKYYHGGEHRLRFHHGRVAHGMHVKAGKRWLSHLNCALDEINLEPSLMKRNQGTEPPLTSKDVRDAIDRFIGHTMCKYAREFSFNADEVMKSGSKSKLPLLESFKKDSDLTTLSVLEIKELLTQGKINYSGCIEKSELLEHLRALLVKNN